MWNFYRDFVPSYSKKVEPLHALTTGFHGMKMRWELLLHPDLERPFQIYADASDQAIRAVIEQDSKPIFFFSKKLTPAQVNYTTTEKELFAIVAVFDHYMTILWGVDITISSDHKNLLDVKRKSNQRIIR